MFLTSVLLARLHVPKLPPLDPRPAPSDVLLAMLIGMLAVLALVFEINNRQRPALIVLWLAVFLYLLFNPSSPLGQ